jgi:hypothetical protein
VGYLTLAKVDAAVAGNDQDTDKLAIQHARNHSGPIAQSA